MNTHFVTNNHFGAATATMTTPPASIGAGTLAALVCDGLQANGKLRSHPTFIRADREAAVAALLSRANVDDAQVLQTFRGDPRRLEVAVRGAGGGEAWLEDVVEQVQARIGLQQG